MGVTSSNSGGVEYKRMALCDNQQLHKLTKALHPPQKNASGGGGGIPSVTGPTRHTAREATKTNTPTAASSREGDGVPLKSNGQDRSR
jgi:hypothetical protein